MTLLRRAQIAGLLLALLAQAGPSIGAEHRARKRPKHPNVTAAPAPVPTEALSIAWEVDVPDTPAPFVVGVADGFVVATRAGRISAYAPSGGQPRWEASLSASISAPPVSMPGRVAIPLDDGWIVMLDASSGHEAARRRIGETRAILSSTSAGLLAADPLGGLSLLDPADASVKWRASLPAAPSAAASLCGDAVLAGTADGTLLGLSAADGSQRWRRKLPQSITTPALCEGRRAWVGSADNRIYALKLRRKSSRVRWSFLTGGDVSGKPLLYGRRVLFSSYDTYLYALEADNGHLAWKVRLGRRPQPENLVVADVLYVAPLNSERLETFRLPGGAQAASFSLPAGRFVTPPAMAASTVVIGAARYGEETARVLGLAARDAKPGQPAQTASSPP